MIIAFISELLKFNYYILPSSTVITVRDNFYDYAVSVDSPLDIKETFPFYLFFEKTEENISCCFQGFPKKYIYKSYSENQKKFSCHITTQEQFTTFMSIIAFQQRNS